MNFDIEGLLVAYGVFVVALSAHEGAHALVAKWGGDWTAFNRGQASLNPLPHMRREPAGMVVVPILTFLSGGFMMGWASVPYHPDWARRFPKRAALMAAAGPTANLILVLLSSWAIIWMCGECDWRLAFRGWDEVVVSPDGDPDLSTRALSMAWIQNLLLVVFNLIPVPPLDGAAMLAGVLPERLRGMWMTALADPRVAGFGLIFVWLGFGRLWGPILSIAYGFLAGLSS